MSAAGSPEIAVLASRYPTLSETFVKREVAGLRALGRPVYTLTLRRPPDAASLLGGVAPADAVLYGPALLQRLAVELLRHPLRSARSLAQALGDALRPGEPTRLRARLALLFQAAAGISAAPLLRRRGIRHLHCHFAHAPTGVGMYAALQLGGSFSFVGHANDLFQNRSLLGRKLERAAFVSCISQWHRDLYAQIAPSAAPRLHVIRCGVELQGFEPAPTADGGEPLRVLSVARLIPKKGIDLLVRALAQIDLPWRLELAGDGPQRDALLALIGELRVADRVQLHGAVPNDRVAELLRHCQLFALPCRIDAAGDRDGIPVALMEAMAAGVPVVAGDLPSLRDLVQPDETGLLVAPGELLPLRDALLRLLRDASLRARLSQAGRRRVAEEFALDVNVARLDAQLQRAAGATGSRS